ncbi:MAG: 4Fe-4S dicluster domain-containing protein [Intestinibacillus sp.]
MNLIQAVKDAGIVGAGGAGFPTHVKLNTKAEWFIVNAAECEPLIETDKYLCRTYADRIIAAVQVVAAHLGARHAVIALKAKYEPEIAALEASIGKAGAPIEIFRMGTFYPAGDEQVMVQMVTGKTVPERGLPLDMGAVVDNVGTLLNIYDAVTAGGSVTTKLLSVTGEVRDTVMLEAPIGTAITECIAAAGPTVTDYAVILGGPMMGRVLTDPAAIEKAVVTKTTGNLLVLPRDHYLMTHHAVGIDRLRLQTHAACIQCRMCTDLCPRYLIGHQMRPHLVMRNLHREKTILDDTQFLAAFGDAANCCSCGVCELFSCPMGLSPRRVNDYMKGQLRARGIQVPRNTDCQAREGLEERRVPTGRLVSRLDLSGYYGRHAHECRTLRPQTVFIPFAQHIGKPAVPVKQTGDTVEKGELLAAAAEGLSANIHASMRGVITEIGPTGAKIAGKEG